jgi:DNA-binding NtrC family response regulator
MNGLPEIRYALCIEDVPTMNAPATGPGHPLHLALAGYEHEWPADFEAFVARELIGRDGALVARLADLGEAPALLVDNEVTALIVNANRLGLKGKVALRECRRVSPSTAVVVVATTAVHGLKDALEGGATAFVAWPASSEVLRLALRSGHEAPAPVSRALHSERGGNGR